MNPEHHTEQVKYLEKDIQRVEVKVNEWGASFTRHLEIYANNGKELAALKQEVANVTQNLNRNSYMLGQLKDAQDEIEKEVSKLLVKVGIAAAVGSTIMTTIAVFILNKLLI